MTSHPVMITFNDIAALRDEAASAGDTEQVRLCEQALGGSGRAYDKCVAAIRDAHAMDN
jgi:hypothetical protein